MFLWQLAQFICAFSPVVRRFLLIHVPLAQKLSSTNVTLGFSAIERREDRLHQRVWIAGRACLAPDPGEVGRGAQFKQTRFLASGGNDRL
jgi:hypothetical protein